MRIGIALRSWIFVLAVFLLSFVPRIGRATWHLVLNEHFNTVQQDADQWHIWPWWTDINANHRWHWNPRPPHIRAQQSYTDYCWGLQYLFYNSKVTRHEDADHAMSLWCGRTNRNDVNNPRPPDDDGYMKDQNAWVWWGPIDLREADRAAMAYWRYMSLDEADTGDYLAICATDDADLLTYADADLLDNVPWGRIHSRAVDGWSFDAVQLDSLYLGADTVWNEDSTLFNIVGEDTVSMLGKNNVWLAFVWRSDGSDVGGKGAFIDDATIMWDDGLFEIVPSKMVFGYPAGGDSVYWSETEPTTSQKVYLGLEWVTSGHIGDTPAFANLCTIDVAGFYSEQLSVTIEPQDSLGKRFFSRTDSMWTVLPNDHEIKWVMDANNEVKETNEDNDLIQMSIHNEWNPPPQIRFWTLTEDETLHVGDSYEVVYEISDSAASDSVFALAFYWVTDTAGISANPDTLFYWPAFYTNYNAHQGVDSLEIRAHYQHGYVEGDWIRIAAMVSDGVPGNITVGFTPGRLYFEPDAVRDEDSPLPVESGIAAAYPNPFNRGLTLEYDLRVNGAVRLGIYDLAGREVSVLADGYQEAGRRRVEWAPAGQPAGLYFVRLEARNGTYLKKVVYLP